MPVDKGLRLGSAVEALAATVHDPGTPAQAVEIGRGQRGLEGIAHLTSVTRSQKQTIWPYSASRAMRSASS